MTENIFSESGKRIRALRGDLSQAGFAKRIGVSSKAVEGWEAGISLPSGTSLLRMREAFGADINVILTGQAGGVAPALRPDEEQLLVHYRAAHSDARERIRQIAATAANSPKRTPKSDQPGIKVGVLHGQYIEGDITNHGGMSFGVPPPTPPVGKPVKPSKK